MTTTAINTTTADTRALGAPRGARPAPAAGVALLALAVTVMLECLRALLPLEWTVSSDIGLVTAAATFPLLFLAPLLVPALRLLGGRAALASAVG